MLAEIAILALWLAAAVALYGAVAAVLAVRRNHTAWAASARHAAHAVAALLVLDIALLTVALLFNRFEIDYVYRHSNRNLPLWLKVSAVWAGQEGSLLVWAALQGVVAAWVAGRSVDRRDASRLWSLAFLHLLSLFFVGMVLFVSNPFTQSVLSPIDGTGLNPLLRHPGMVFHPPLLLAGYVVLSAPFALALAALITGDVDGWIERVRPWILVAWLCLGLGLLLGARWAYDVLGWGGYWGWDPVENAGLMPWLTATALLHGGIMQSRRRGMRLWNVILAALSFWLVIFGTFATRSGVIQSVHAYARSNLSTPFLILMALIGGASMVAVVTRRALLFDPDDAPYTWQQYAFGLTLLLFLSLTLSIWIGSVLPTLTEWAGIGRLEAGPEWFDRVTGPQFAALLLVMGVCPLAGTTARAFGRLRRRVPAIVVGVILASLGAWLVGVDDLRVVATLALAGLAGAALLAELWESARPRDVDGPTRPSDLFRAMGRRRRYYGAHLVHLGVILMAVGIIGTRMNSSEYQVVLTGGQPQRLGAYTLIYEDLTRDVAPADHDTYRATVQVYHDGDYLVTLSPEMHHYAAHTQTVAVPAIRVSAREDLYLILAGWNDAADTATFKVHVNRLVNWLWLGGLVVLAGGALAAWPARHAAESSAWARWRLRNVPGFAAGGLLLIGAMVSMWGVSHGAHVERLPRPQAGVAAPDFSLSLLDGSSFSLADARGEVVVLNFWASWCPTCLEWAPLLDEIWEEYRHRGVRLLGIAVTDDIESVTAVAERSMLSYPLALDEADGRITRVYGVTGVPTLVVIDEEGRVAYRRSGHRAIAQLRAELDRLLSAGGSDAP